MKNRYLAVVVVLGAALFPTLAFAENVSGTVTSVDPSGQTVTLRRADTNGNVTVHVTDKNALNNVAAGSRVTFDANQRTYGNWETSAIDVTGSGATLTPQVTGSTGGVLSGTTPGTGVNTSFDTTRTSATPGTAVADASGINAGTASMNTGADLNSGYTRNGMSPAMNANTAGTGTVSSSAPASSAGSSANAGGSAAGAGSAGR